MAGFAVTTEGCVADLDEDYIADMEDTLETYERPYDPQQPWCV